ncbi:MAG: SH3 domain-containing protein [Devosia sp.]|nr:SH3 domain-containing protein [Devosia sp.]
MSAVPRFAPVAALLFALALHALPAQALETGTAAWLIKGQALFEGPGRAYVVVGELGDETGIRVDRCTYRWCRIHAGGQRGWVSRDNIGFGQRPRGPSTGPRLDHPRGGTVCFFEGRNFSGDSVCAGSGAVVRDLLLFGRDNRYSSIQIDGASVMVCRDRDFTGYCELIVASQPAMHGFLDDNVSSYRVY